MAERDAMRAMPPSGPPAADAGRAGRVDWLPLLRRITEACPEWLSWKNVESALTGVGDVDAVAPGDSWDRITLEFRRWAVEYGLGPVIECPHAPFLRHLVALSPVRPEFYELDLNRRKIFLGSTLFLPADLLPLTIADERGFRRLRPGAEGLLKLIQNGAYHDGRPNTAALQAKGIRELLSQDPEGVRACAWLFGRARGAVLRASDALLSGTWARRAVLMVNAWSLLRAVAEPDGVMARIRFRINRRTCPVLRAVFAGRRRTPPDRERWLADVAMTHIVHRDTSVF
jgi:hypothetical protein